MRASDGWRAVGWGAAACASFLAAAEPAAAGSFSISPIRVDLGGAHHTEVFTIRNEDDAPVLIQVRTVAWSQDAGEEKYLDSQELLTTPPVFQIAPKGEQIVRVALRRSVDPTRELDYRLFFQEVPPETAKPSNGLSVALRLSVPVFVLPATPVQSQLVWQAHALEHGSLQIDVSNRGTAHRHIMDFDLQFGTASAHVGVARYVLPGGHVSWTVTPPKDAEQQAKLAVHGTSDEGEFYAEVARIGS